MKRIRRQPVTEPDHIATVSGYFLFLPTYHANALVNALARQMRTGIELAYHRCGF